MFRDSFIHNMWIFYLQYYPEKHFVPVYRKSLYNITYPEREVFRSGLQKITQRKTQLREHQIQVAMSHAHLSTIGIVFKLEKYFYN